ncbi:MAG: glycoside hydrolase family 2 [Lachnospiraceae bacterium]|nr:glycoside hydrolase family 2 [Lachnospiraceae bacterium]
MEQLYTIWGKNQKASQNAAGVLEEYPRPLMVRDGYRCLNGKWEYAITKSEHLPENYDGEILVPFSPEAALSGVNRQLQPDEYLWYRRKNVDTSALKKRKDDRILIHFGAVDQECTVYVNGKEAIRHVGGYLPFEEDITEYWKASNEILVRVRDLSDTSYRAKGKQKLKRGGMFYTAQSGIWQTVWLECVPKEYIREIAAIPDPDTGTVRMIVHSDADLPVAIAVKEAALYGTEPDYRTLSGEEEEAEPKSAEGERNREISAIADRKREICARAADRSNQEFIITIPDAKIWNCDTPYLYYYTAAMGQDVVTGYFAMRTVTIEPDEKGIPRICLNHNVIFQRGVLDQGYWPDGLYTAPSDEALIFDIAEMKKLGFNMLRKHIKIEPQRWYYHCDRLGMLVWQDMVNGGTYYRHWFVTYLATVCAMLGIRVKDSHKWLLSRKDKEGRKEFIREMVETVRVLKGHPSIVTWVIFNEGWGQFGTADMTRLLRKQDQTRLIDSASGWFDQGCGDFKSIHNYFFKLKGKPEAKRALVLSEYGGYSMKIAGHSACEGEYGYGTYKEKGALNQAFEKREKEVKKWEKTGLCASVYTQVSDVEEEVNGIFTYDRAVRKIGGEA